MIFSMIAGFAVSFVLIKLFMNRLPRDAGRAFAVNGQLSVGKLRGAGLIMMIAFAITVLLFGNVTIENVIYILVIEASMLTGYLDDRSGKPWGRVKKGLADLVIALAGAVNFVFFNGSVIKGFFFDYSITIPAWLMVIILVAFIFGSINVTNCTDGVDGLCGSLCIASMLTFFVILTRTAPGVTQDFGGMILAMCGIIAGYLVFNCSPSVLLMGDAGSRALGVFLAIAAFKTGNPLSFIPVCLVILVDGGLGLIKILAIKILKFNPMKNLRTPLHDHFRKNKGWSDTQTVARFLIAQCFIAVCVIYLIF